MSHHHLGTLRPEVNRDVRALITHLTGFDTDEENFGLCLDYAASNLLYHNMLDPEKRNVDKWMDGLKEKFLVHAERQRAADLDYLLGKYDAAEVFRERHEQHDVKVRLLSLLTHLSEKPLGAEWDGVTEAEAIDEEDEEEVVDWRKLLAEGEEEWRPPGDGDDEDELSEWTESEEDEEEGDGEEVVSRSKWSRKPSLLEVPKNEKDGKATGKESEDVSSLVQSQYWRQQQQSSSSPVVVDSAFPSSARFSARVDALNRAAGVNTARRVVLSEYQVVRECIWSMRNPAPSTVFEVGESGTFSAVANVCLSSVTAGTLGDALSPVCGLLSHLRILFDFIEGVFAEQKNFDSTVPFTYEAYAGALSELLHIFFGVLISVEEKAAKQEETFTLFDLVSSLEDWPAVVSRLHRCHVGLVGLSRDKGHSNWQKALVLLSGLHSQISASSHVQFLADAFLNLYLKSCQPYLRIAGLWLAEGRLEDFRDEFVFRHRTEEGNGGIESEDFWTSGMEERDYASFLASEGMEAPEMLAETLSDVLVSGKSVEILTVLRKKRVIPPSPNNNDCLSSRPHCRDLLASFLEMIKEQLGGSGDDADSGTTEQVGARKRTLRLDSRLDPEDLDMDPYLAMAFAEACATTTAEDEVDSSSSSSSKLLGSFYIVRGSDPLRPVPLVLSRCLGKLVSGFYVSSCDALSSLILHTLDLGHHMGAVRKVFLMEAGDLMFEFHSDLFRRLEEDRDLDSVSVTLFLQDCLARRYHGEADRFSLVLPEQGATTTAEDYLDGLELKYEVSWPLNIVLSSRALSVYNRVFRFILRVKRALWSLRQIRAKELIERLAEEEERMARKEEEDDGEDESALSPSLKMHRVLLLRSWLLHFVGNVHSYFMSRVLHATDLELRSALAACTDLDQILKAHGEYLGRVVDRCFLHPSARVLRDAVDKVLTVCHELKSICEDDVGGEYASSASKLDSCEEVYSRSHQFLSSTLTSMTQKRNVPHLDGLAAALAHSCPQRNN